MTASAATSLQQGSAARRVESDILQALRFRSFDEYPQSSDRGSRQITDVLDREDIGAAPASNGNYHFSTDERYDFHDTSPSLMGSTYRRRDVNTPPMKCKSVHISPQCVDSALGPIIRNRPVKTVAYAAGRSAEAVKKWRKTALPEAWAALINLLTSDDDVYLAVMELAGRKPVAALTDNQKRALSEAMKMLGME